MSNDIIVFHKKEEDDDKTVFQTEEDRKKLERELFGDQEPDDEVETTMRMISKNRPYWQNMFG